jgi:hypothetical protein
MNEKQLQRAFQLQRQQKQQLTWIDFSSILTSARASTSAHRLNMKCL